MIAIIPADRSVIRLPLGLVLQTGADAELLCMKRQAARKFIRQQKVRKLRPLGSLPRLRVVS